jgi:hypothetical protein
MKDKFYSLMIRYQGAVSFLLVMFLLALGAAFSVANAQELPEGLNGEMVEIPMICGPTATMYNSLFETHGERPVMLAFSKSKNAVVWFVNEEGTSMSVVVDTPMRSCLIYSTKCLPGDCYFKAENLPEVLKEEAEKQMRNMKGVEL